ncbi:MAG: exonuclease SbcCD subunit D [Verrucomicrobiales bacterium]
MFRFLHTADLHLDSPMIGLASREGAAVDAILSASRRAFENLINLAIAEQVAFVVIAGDVYDRDWKGYETGLFFRGALVRLREAGIRVFLISGNHDAASVISRKLSLPEGVVVISSRSPETHELHDLPVAVHGMSFPNRAVPENLVPRYPAPVPGSFNLGLLHTSLAGDVRHDTYAPCSVDELIEKGYDYWALGHIHQPDLIHEDPWIVYPGNLQGRSVRECGARGCRLVSVSDTQTVMDCQWHALDVVRWAVATVDATDLGTVEDIAMQARRALVREIYAADGRLLAVRLIVKGVTDLHSALHSRPDRLQAEIDACVEELGEERLWIEQVRVETAPTVSLEALAGRDQLTKMVVETVQHGSMDETLPGEITAMLELLPPVLREFLKAEIAGEGRARLMQIAGQMILNRLTTKGGDV